MRTQLETPYVHKPHPSILRATNGFYIIKSKSQNEKRYIIKRKGANIWTCTCPDYYHRLQKFADDTRCKHILLAEIYQNSFDEGFKINVNHVAENFTFTPRPKICRKCGSEDIKKSGFRKTLKGVKRQRHTCKECGFRFILGENGFRKLKADPETIIEALNLVLHGMSLRGIAEHLKITKHLRISHQTVDNWFKKYMAIINEFVNNILPTYQSQYWCLDEMVLNVRNTRKIGWGYYVWLWNVIDPKTRFVIASEVSKRRELGDAQRVISHAKYNILKKPNYVITDALPAYGKALLQEFEQKVVHVKTKSFSEGFQNRPVERYHNEIREKLKAKRGLGNDKSAQNFADNYRTYHNFIRPHSGFKDNITPAEACGIDLNLGENKLANLLRKGIKYKYNFETQLKKRIRFVRIYYEEDCTRVSPKNIIDKRIWREINDILRLNGFVWLSNGSESCWIRS